MRVPPFGSVRSRPGVLPSGGAPEAESMHEVLRRQTPPGLSPCRAERPPRVLIGERSSHTPSRGVDRCSRSHPNRFRTASPSRPQTPAPARLDDGKQGYRPPIEFIVCLAPAASLGSSSKGARQPRTGPEAATGSTGTRCGASVRGYGWFSTGEPRAARSWPSIHDVKSLRINANVPRYQRTEEQGLPPEPTRRAGSGSSEATGRRRATSRGGGYGKLRCRREACADRPRFEGERSRGRHAGSLTAVPGRRPRPGRSIPSVASRSFDR